MLPKIHAQNDSKYLVPTCLTSFSGTRCKRNIFAVECMRQVYASTVPSVPQDSKIRFRIDIRFVAFGA